MPVYAFCSTLAAKVNLTSVFAERLESVSGFTDTKDFPTDLKTGAVTSGEENTRLEEVILRYSGDSFQEGLHCLSFPKTALRSNAGRWGSDHQQVLFLFSLTKK